MPRTIAGLEFKFVKFTFNIIRTDGIVLDRGVDTNRKVAGILHDDRGVQVVESGIGPDSVLR